MTLTLVLTLTLDAGAEADADAHVGVSLPWILMPIECFFRRLRQDIQLSCAAWAYRQISKGVVEPHNTQFYVLSWLKHASVFVVSDNWDVDTDVDVDVDVDMSHQQTTIVTILLVL